MLCLFCSFCWIVCIVFVESVFEILVRKVDLNTCQFCIDNEVFFVLCCF